MLTVITVVDKEHYVAKVGTSSIPKHFFAQNGKVDVKTGLFLKSLSQNENGQIVAETRCGVVDTFDYALVSIPAPQLLNDVKLGLRVQHFLLCSKKLSAFALHRQKDNRKAESYIFDYLKFLVCVIVDY